MYCSECGKEIPEDSKFCPFCSKPVVRVSRSAGWSGEEGLVRPSTTTEGQTDGTGLPVPKRSIFVLLFLILITAGIYEAFWYKKVSRFLNGLSVEKRFGPEPFWVFLVGNITGLWLSFMEGWYEVAGKSIDLINLASGAIWLVMTIVLLVMCFRMIACLREYHEGWGEEFKSNRFFTVIFNAFYVQYKLNRM